ncbi:BspA family leucine-rich repeat surface protein [Shewanella nanhaiensis]|uniref:BspA family leucine-rich repeat surface protein n=1 Tax=Shewanella nanhaiensis TaxID=2864872 RepID=A0ABS7DY50_9GAMM|nr:BspA family leucine-rich repeat surface protein [Shewanella nanhaiensis]MBW8182348.1 BspA family leucine-rich repeat surface protein [Shewanella nanhaiensis]
MRVWFVSLSVIVSNSVSSVLALILYLLPLVCLAATTDDFVITIKSDNAGTSSDVQFTLPTTGSGYNYNIDCDDDGTDEATAQTADYTCDYTSLGGAGTYTVRVEDNSGASTGFPRIYFNNGGDKEKILTVQQWGTGKWTSMQSAFQGAVNLTVPATDVPDLALVTSTRSMFDGATLANPNTSSWNTSAVTSMRSMFLNATSATPDTSSWDTSSVTNMRSIFNGATSANPDVSSWDTSSATSMYAMFFGATSATPDTSSWDTSSVTTMRSMFSGATAANPDTSGWNMSAVTSIKLMFFNAEVATPNTSSWNTSAVIDMSSAFSGATNANPNVSSWDTSNVTTMEGMFWDATNANPDVSSWNTASVTQMSNMFNGATVAEPDTSLWDTAAVTNMSYMFLDAINANPNVSAWNTGSVTNMEGMFRAATSAIPDVSGWNTNSVTNMSYLFLDATSATPNTTAWNTSNVVTLEGMFWDATNANPDVSSWNTANVTNMNFVFLDASSANPDVSAWNTSSVITMNNMFQRALSANPDVSNWDVSNVTQMSSMFSEVTLTTANYDALLTAWNGQTLQNGVSFDGGNSKYCSGESARDNLIASDSWVITDGGKSCPDMHFVTTWKTDNSGSSNSTSITIPTTGTGYSYDVDWDNDGTFDEFGLTGSVTHDFGAAGNRTVRIRGEFPRIYFSNAGDKEKILSVDQWGAGVWTSMQDAFYGASNLTVPATDAPVLTSVTSLRAMFRDATTMDDDINHWDTSNITNMLDTFRGASAFNQNISSWDTSKVFTMQAMFEGASAFNQNISTWDTSALITMLTMFQDANDFNQPIGTWNTSKVTNMSFLFDGATAFNQDISSWDTSKVTVMVSMFQDATNFDQNLANWDIPNVNNMNLMFSGVTLSKSNYDALLIGFNAQVLQSGVSFDGGNSVYCAGEGARANMIASDSWVITDGGKECTPVTPSQTPDLLVTSDSGVVSSDNITLDNTPSLDINCSNIGNTITLYSDNPTTNTNLATQICTSVGTESITASVLSDGDHNISYTDTLSGDESAHSPTLLVKIDTAEPAVPSCSSSPSTANDSTNISTTCTGVETGSSLTIVNMSCSPTPATTSNTVLCSGTIGSGGGEISTSNDTVSVTDLAGNSQTGETTGLVIDNSAPAITESLVISTPTSDSTPSYSFSSTEAGSISYLGSCSSATSVAVSGSNTITFNALADGNYSDCQLRVTDSAGNLSNLLSVSSFVVDSAGASLSEVTPVATPTSDSTPSYSFSSTEAGSISYLGSCSSATSVAVSGSNTITFNALADGNYSDCQLRVTDSAGNLSSLLSVSSFVVDSAGASLSEVTPVATPTSDSTPSYSFSSTEAGSISYLGSCSSATSVAVSGSNIITFNALADGNYSDCQLRVTDPAGNLSNLLSVSSFVVDSAGASLSEVTPVATPTSDSTPSYSFSSTEAGSISYLGSCSSATSVAVSGSNTITFNVLADGNYSDCQLRVTDPAGNLSNLLSVSSFVVDSAGASLSEVTPVATPTSDNKPSYSFSSTEAGSISYLGSCSSSTVIAAEGENTITFNELEDGYYSDCQLRVTDIAGNASNLLSVTAFVVDKLLLSLETQLPDTLLQDEHLLVTQKVIGGEAPFVFRADNLPEWLQLDSATGEVKGAPGVKDIATYSGITFHISDSQEREAKSVTFELRVIDINDAPIAEDDSFTLVEGQKGLIEVLVNDSDPDEEDLITLQEASAVLGEVTLVGDKLEYQSPLDFVGTDILSYTIADSGGLTATANVEVSITSDPELGAPPTLVLPQDIEVNATGLLTKVSLGFATAKDHLGNPISVSQSSGSYFEPGNHQVLWTAEDARGRKTSRSQSVKVHPLISLRSDTHVQEGGAVSLGFYLNGDAPNYPVVLDYSLGGTADENDHDLHSGSISLTQGRLGHIHFKTFSDSLIEGDETLEIKLSDEANLAGKSVHLLTITEEAHAPDIRLKPLQAGVETYTVKDTEGLVTVYTLVDSGDVAEASYRWFSSEEIVNHSTQASQFVFDPQEISPGNVQISLVLTSAQGLEVTARVNMLIQSQAVVLATPENCSVINEQESDGRLFLVESEAETCIMRGDFALQSRSGGIQILDDELTSLLDNSQILEGGVFDFVIFGKPKGSDYQVVFPQRKPIPKEAVYLKFSQQGSEWVDFDTSEGDQLASAHSNQGLCPEPNDPSWISGLTAGDWCLRLTIREGGLNDSDGMENGILMDPGGLTDLESFKSIDNHDPVAVDDVIELVRGGEVSLDVLDNDSDSDGDNLVVIEAVAELGSTEIIDGVIWYRPISESFLGNDTISYVISDEMGGVAKANVLLDVVTGNSLPLAVNDELTMLVNSQASIDVLSNDSDPDGDRLSLHRVSSDIGRVEVSGDKLLITPDREFLGEFQVTYFIIDPSGAMAAAQVHITVKEGEKIEIKNDSGGVMSLLLLLLLYSSILRLWSYRGSRL